MDQFLNIVQLTFNWPSHEVMKFSFQEGDEIILKEGQVKVKPWWNPSFPGCPREGQGHGETPSRPAGPEGQGQQEGRGRQILV